MPSQPVPLPSDLPSLELSGGGRDLHRNRIARLRHGLFQLLNGHLARMAIFPGRPQFLAGRHAHGHHGNLRLDGLEEWLGGRVGGAVVADQIHIGSQQGRAVMMVDHPFDPSLLEVAGDQQGGLAKVDAKDHRVVVCVVECALRPAGVLVGCAPQDRDFWIDGGTIDRVDDLGGGPFFFSILLTFAAKKPIGWASLSLSEIFS